MPKVIEAKNLSFSYRVEPIFTKINFSVYNGDFVAVIGSNGAGKSTLIQLILGELTPSEGYIHLFGQDVSRFKNWPKIGYVPQAGLQSYVSFPATAEEIVTANLFSQIGLMHLPKKKHINKALKALESVGMGEYSKRLIGDLSGGQRQRVMLARVLVSDPKLMILDEPTTGIDFKNVESFYNLLSTLNHKMGITIIMVTHDMERTSNHASRILCLEDGSLMELTGEQITEELLHKHKHPAQNFYKREDL
jgi:zinc transport system ATP-binding protein